MPSGGRHDNRLGYLSSPIWRAGRVVVSNLRWCMSGCMEDGTVREGVGRMTICHPAIFTDNAAVARDCAAKVPIEVIQQRYGLTKNAIKSISRWYGCSGNNTSKIIGIPEEEELEVVRLYEEEGLSMTAIARRFGLKSKHGVERVLKAHNVTMRQSGNHPEPLAPEYYDFYIWQTKQGYTDGVARNAAQRIKRCHLAGATDPDKELPKSLQGGINPAAERGNNLTVMRRYAEFKKVTA